MTEKKVWLITGAGRGMGIDIARAALAAGHAVVATARNADTITAALGDRDDVLAVKLDITDPSDAEAAVRAAVDRFGRIDVLVNNAGNFYAGLFEEITPEDFRAQVETNLFGPLNVTRAVLPVMRAQSSGLVIAISSTAGIARLQLYVAVLAIDSSFNDCSSATIFCCSAQARATQPTASDMNSTWTNKVDGNM